MVMMRKDMEMEKRVACVSFSPSGTTKTITERIAGAFSGARENYSLLHFSGKKLQLSRKDVLVVGFPVFSGRLPSPAKELLEHISGEGTPAVAVVVYGNREYEDALLELKDLLEQKGFLTIGAGAFIARHSIFPQVAKDRPDQEDWTKIGQFAGQCAQKITDSEDQPLSSVSVKGNTPYREIAPVPLKPSGNKNCTACGACAAICPVHAISAESPRKTDHALCISCTACIEVCPRKARGFRGPAYPIAAKMFEKKCSARKEPETFI